MKNEEQKLNIFGFDVNVQPKGVLTTVIKTDDDGIVYLIKQSQDFCKSQMPIYTMRNYGKTADEFIHEFKKQCIKINQNKLPPCIPPSDAKEKV